MVGAGTVGAGAVVLGVVGAGTVGAGAVVLGVLVLGAVLPEGTLTAPEGREALVTVHFSPLTEKVFGARFVPVEEAWNRRPTPVPGAMVRFWVTGRTVTTVPDCLYLPFQPLITRCPAGKVHFSFQPFTAAVPVFFSVMLAVKLPFPCEVTV